jgi:hypothetical protein
LCGSISELVNAHLPGLGFVGIVSQDFPDIILEDHLTVEELFFCDIQVLFKINNVLLKGVAFDFIEGWHRGDCDDSNSE